MRKTLAALSLTVCLVFASAATISSVSCVPPPPTLSVQASRDFQATRVITALDQLRDTAIAANSQVPPLLSTATTRAIVLYHEAALKTIQATTDTSWVAGVQTGLDQLVANLPAKEAAIVAPYVALVKAILTAVVKP